MQIDYFVPAISVNLGMGRNLGTWWREFYIGDAIGLGTSVL